MRKTALRNATIVNEGQILQGDLLITGDRIERIGTIDTAVDENIDLKGDFLLPGVIDDQVHFREPGMTHKANIATESKAALAGGVTSFMEMPNTNPPALTQDKLEEKYLIAAGSSYTNYSFFMGVSNDNYEEVMNTDPSQVCGVKIFMGSSTGNMLVDNENQLEKIFSNTPMLIATHCEDETTILQNTAFFQDIYGDDIPFVLHPDIRSRQACYLSSSLAISLARKHGSRLHLLHISTADEVRLFDNSVPLAEKNITTEVCVHHLTFDSRDYKTQGGLIKCNPAIKRPHDRHALWEALLDDRLDIVATDHAPHTIEEKTNPYVKCPSGLPLVQHSLVQMLEHVHEGRLTLTQLVHKMSHAPAVCFRIRDRGYIREGYKADLVQVSRQDPWKVDKSNILYKCGWSPFEGKEFQSRVQRTFLNGRLAYESGLFGKELAGERLLFET
ncbi:MAG TPA: dihydroorotase [Membranihabitans sp.]|nr:dihydroorotase [Membranihabitans sp.]